MNKDLIVWEPKIKILNHLVDELHQEDEFLGTFAKLKLKDFNKRFKEILPKDPINRLKYLIDLHLTNVINLFLEEEDFHRNLYVQLNPPENDCSPIFQFIASIPLFNRLSTLLGTEKYLPRIILDRFKEDLSDTKLFKTISEIDNISEFEKFIFLSNSGSFLLFNVEKLSLNRFTKNINQEELLVLNYQLKAGKSPLIKGNWMSAIPERNLVDLELTQKSIELIFPTLEYKETPKNQEKGKQKNKGFLIYKPKDLEEKMLFFNENNLKFKNRIYEILNNLTKDKLQSHSISLLISGYPGTGKTEFAKQLCKNMGYSLMFIEASEIQSKWVGETEQNIHQVFKTYKELNDHSPQPMVLLFNESDQLFSKKLTVERSNDIHSNSIQSQLLNEMEKFKGIIICTCNSTENLEEAFKRRFLFHSVFDPPTKEVRKQLWQSTIGFWQLDENLTTTLSEHDLTGAEIQNISTKFNLLKSDDDLYVFNINLLEELIEEVVISRNKTCKIGF